MASAVDSWWASELRPTHPPPAAMQFWSPCLKQCRSIETMGRHPLADATGTVHRYTHTPARGGHVKAQTGCAGVSRRTCIILVDTLFIGKKMAQHRAALRPHLRARPSTRRDLVHSGRVPTSNSASRIRGGVCIDKANPADNPALFWSRGGRRIAAADSTYRRWSPLVACGLGHLHTRECRNSGTPHGAGARRRAPFRRP